VKIAVIAAVRSAIDARDAPKSISVGLLLASRMILAGLTSRWRKPVLCTASSPVEQSFEQTFGVGRRQLAIAPETLVEGVAARQPHDHVGRSVGLEKVVDADDGWRPLEGRQNPGFLEKAITSPDEVFRKFASSGARPSCPREGRGSSAGTP